MWLHNKRALVTKNQFSRWMCWKFDICVILSKRIFIYPFSDRNTVRTSAYSVKKSTLKRKDSIGATSQKWKNVKSVSDGWVFINSLFVSPLISNMIHFPNLEVFPLDSKLNFLSEIVKNWKMIFWLLRLYYYFWSQIGKFVKEVIISVLD